MREPDRFIAGVFFMLVVSLTYAGSATAKSVYVPENSAVTKRLRGVAVDSQPAVNMNDYPTGKDSYPGIDGHLVADTLAGRKNASGVEVFLIPDSAYTEWWARLAVENAHGYQDHIAGDYDKRLTEFYFKKTTTDFNGNFHFYQVDPGTWIVLASYTIDRGLVAPADRIQPAIDGNDKRTSVLAPAETFDSNHFVGQVFGYLYAFTFTDPTADGWNVGDVPNSLRFVNGEEK